MSTALSKNFLDHKLFFLLSFALGAFSGLAFAPMYLWPFISISLLGLLKILEPMPRKMMLFLFFVWCFGLFFVSFHWICLSLFVEFDKFWFLIPFCMMGIPAILAAIHTSILAGALSFFHITKPYGPLFFTAFIFSWCLSEWIRGCLIFGGFPWNFIIHAWGNNVFMMQGLSLVGSYGLSAITLCFLSIPYLWLGRDFSLKQRSILTATLAFIIFGLTFWGHHRIQKSVTFHAKPWIRLVQPNIAQSDKMNPSKISDILNILKELTQKPSSRPLTHIIWPEAALPFLSTKSDVATFALPTRFPEVLITGLCRQAQGRIYNSLVAIDPNGHISNIYDKYHLVPFGEYIPGRIWLRLDGITALTLDRHDFTPGQLLQTISLPGLPSFSPLICFDTAFSGEVTLPATRPEWLLELTNNAWFGDSWGLAQHLDLGIFRAIEEGLPLVRVTNTGVSCVISPYGRVLHKLPSHEAGVIDFALPEATTPTWFCLWRQGPFWIFLTALFIALLWATATPLTKEQKRKGKQKKK